MGQPPEGSPPPAGIRGRAGWIAGAYAVLGILWIGGSDRLVAALISDPAVVSGVGSAKGYGFVLVTALLLLLVLRQTFGSVERGLVRLRAAEQRLQTSETRLAGVIASAMDAIVVTDDDDRIVLLNPAAERMFSVSGADLLGRTLAPFIDVDALELPTARADSGRRVLAGRRSDGTPFPVEIAADRSRTEAEELSVLVLRDISARRAREQALDRLNCLYAALHEVVVVLATDGDTDAVFTDACRVLVEKGELSMAWVGWLDRDTDRVVPGPRWGDAGDYLGAVAILRDGDRPEGRGPTGTAVREGRPYICTDVRSAPVPEYWRSHAMAHGYRSAAVIPIRMRDRVVGALSVFDTTAERFRSEEIALLTTAAEDMGAALESRVLAQERRAAEAATAEERRLSDTMIESLPGIVYFFDDELRFLRWNENFLEVSGYAARELGTLTPLELFAAEDQERVRETIERVFREGEASVEAPFLSKSGRRTPYLLTGRRVVYHERSCLIGMGLDISERIAAEHALRELNASLETRVVERTRELAHALDRAEAADRLKSSFLATMSHELRTPLNSILGFTGIVLRGMAGPLNDEQERQLTMVRGSARHLLDLINDVLDLSKIEAGELAVGRDPFDLPASIEQVAGSVRPLAAERGVDLRLDIDPRLGTLVGDRRRVEQILLNLLSNALKFTTGGSVRLSAALAPEPAPPVVRIHVADTGCGIREDELPGLFRPFAQVDTGLARRHEGTGLGLVICRRLLDLMGGRIDVESEYGVGSVFTVELPLEPGP